MAVRIPLIVDYNGKGLDKLKREFAQLDGIAAKSKFALEKAFLPATIVLGGLAAAGVDAAKAAMDDAKGQAILAGVLRKTTKATDKQVAAVEDYIKKQTRLKAVTDDDLRPAFADLVRVTKDTTKAQELLELAMDVSIGTGNELSSVTDAFTKAVGGNMRGLQTLAPELRTAIREGESLDNVFGLLGETFGGAAAANAETAAGKFEIMKNRFNELKEEIGARLLPLVERYFLPALEKITGWAEKNPGVIAAVAAAFGALAGAIVIVNVAMMLNPWVLLVAGLLILTGVVAYLWRTNERFRDTLKSVWEWMGKIYERAKPLIDRLVPIAGLLGGISNFAKGGFKGVLKGFLPDLTPGFNIPGIPFLAQGGVVTSPTLAMIGEGREPEAVVPLSKLGAMGGSTTNVTINVSGGDPQAIVNALVRWSRANGVLPSTIRVA